MKNKFVFVMLALCLLVTSCSTSKPAQQAVTSNGFECPAPSPRLEVSSKILNMFVWTEYIPSDIVDCFELLYGVDVNVEYFSSNEELYAKLSSVKDSNPYDIVHPSDYMINVLIRHELLAKLDWSKLENAKNLEEGYTKMYGGALDYVVPYQLGTQAIVYNSATVQVPPTSWADLWKPEFENRIVSVDDSRVLIGAALLTLGYDVNITDKNQLDEAKKKLDELMPNVLVFDSDSPKSALIAGDADLGIVWNGEAFLAQQENPEMKYVFPSEGSISFVDGLGLVKGAGHEDAAYAFFNYMLQGDVFWLTLQDYPYTNPNRAALEFAKENHADVYNAYMASEVTNTPPIVFQASHTIEDVGDALTLYDEIWLEVKAGASK